MASYHVTYRLSVSGTWKTRTVDSIGLTELIAHIRECFPDGEWIAIPTSGPKPYTPPAQLPPIRLFSQDKLHPATCPKRYGGRRDGAITQDQTADIDNIPPTGRMIDGVAYNRNLKRNDLVAIQCGMVTSEIMKKARK